jgi:hypothetical protein
MMALMIVQVATTNHLLPEVVPMLRLRRKPKLTDAANARKGDIQGSKTTTQNAT